MNASVIYKKTKRISDKDFYDESEAVYTNPEKRSRSRYTNLLQEISLLIVKILFSGAHRPRT